MTTKTGSVWKVVALENGQGEDSVRTEAPQYRAASEAEAREWVLAHAGEWEFGYAIVSPEGAVDYGAGFGHGWPSTTD